MSEETELTELDCDTKPTWEDLLRLCVDCIFVVFDTEEPERLFPMLSHSDLVLTARSEMFTEDDDGAVRFANDDAAVSWLKGLIADWKANRTAHEITEGEMGYSK